MQKRPGSVRSRALKRPRYQEDNLNAALALLERPDRYHGVMLDWALRVWAREGSAAPSLPVRIPATPKRTEDRLRAKKEAVHG